MRVMSSALVAVRSSPARVTQFGKAPRCLAVPPWRRVLAKALQLVCLPEHPLRDETPKVVHKLSTGQADALKAALKDLVDARKLLDPTAG